MAGLFRKRTTTKFASIDMFFDSSKVKAAVDKATRANLSKGGAFIRRRARQSMRSTTSQEQQQKDIAEGKRKRLRKTKASPQGTPPRAVRPGQKIKKFLFFKWDPGTRSVVIGPERLARGSNPRAPRLHEKGGRARRRNPLRRIRKLGGGGEIRVANNQATYTLMRTQAQVDRANRINEDLFGPMTLNAMYPERPFMGPALQKVIPSLPPMWTNTVI